MTEGAPDRWQQVAGLRDAIQGRFDRLGDADEGLRERKKRLTRQQISDTATGMFLERGFDEVRVAEVAAACGVSEKTVYNYFPTKESLLLDREDSMVEAVRRALGPDAPPGSPIEALVGELIDELDAMYEHWDDEHDVDLTVIQRFSELVEGTPSLRAAQRDMMDRIAQVAAESLAERAGMDPTDPEPQIAADALVGLWRVQYTAMKKYSDGSRTPDEVHDAVVDEIRRAARLVDTGLWSFNLVVQGSTTRQQLKVAADAANDARKQVVVAIKAARDAWREVAAEVQSHHQNDTGDDRRGQRDPRGPRGDRGNRADRELIQQTVQRERQNAQREVQKAKREVQKAHREVRKATAQAKAAKDSRPTRGPRRPH
jgi:AcrR family transcriptional regulator